MPQIVATERWSDQSFKPGESAERTWDVVGAETELQAAYAPGIPQKGDPHPRDASLKVDSVPDVRRPGFGLYQVRASYKYAPEPGQDPKTDPLNEPPVIRWRPGLESVPMDRDADGVPLLNSAGDALDPPPNVDVPTLTLSVTRNEPFYDPRAHMEYSRRVNAGAWVVPGTNGLSVEEGRARCVSIAPAADYSPGAGFVPVAYEFEFAADGFDHRVLDQGLQGWGAPKNQGNDADPRFKAAFYVKTTETTGKEVGGPVLLDGAGRPLRAGPSVGPTFRQPLTTPYSVNPLEIVKTDDAAFLIYKKHLRKSFAPLKLS